MEINGLVKTSLIDYPEKIAAVIFTQGCNFQCGFCHNPDLIEIKKGGVTPADVYKYLETRIGKLDGVVITGGEPLIQNDLKTFIERVKKMGLLIKLDTNGSNPSKLESFMHQNLLDYIAMDIKGPLEDYPVISKYSNKNVIHKSIKVLMGSEAKYEFRSTVLPFYHRITDFHKIGKLIYGAKIYTIQGFRPQITFDKKLQDKRSFTRKELEEIAKIMKKYVERVVIHDNLS